MSVWIVYEEDGSVAGVYSSYKGALEAMVECDNLYVQEWSVQ